MRLFTNHINSSNNFSSNSDPYRKQVYLADILIYMYCLLQAQQLEFQFNSLQQFLTNKKMKFVLLICLMILNLIHSCHYGCEICMPFMSGGGLCRKCYHNRQMAVSQQCVCSEGSYDNGIGPCLRCPKECKTCKDAHICTSCDYQKQLTQDGKCVCTRGYYQDTPANCKSCSQSCETCDKNGCTSCGNDKILVDGECQCRSGQVLNIEGFCETTCNQQKNCRTCNQHKQCLSCPAGKALENGACIFCSSNQILQDGVCKTCEGGKIKINQKCVCLDGQYQSEGRTCLQCPKNCLTCQDSKYCLSCHQKEALINGRCSQKVTRLQHHSASKDTNLNYWLVFGLLFGGLFCLLVVGVLVFKCKGKGQVANQTENQQSLVRQESSQVREQKNKQKSREQISQSGQSSNKSEPNSEYKIIRSNPSEQINSSSNGEQLQSVSSE